MDWVFFLVKMIFAFAVMNAGLVGVAFLVYFERKIAAHMQARMGPNRAGPLGLLQSFADLLKGLKKETIIPKEADKWVFLVAPVVTTGVALAGLAFVPFGPRAAQPGHINLFGRQIDWFIAADLSVAMLILLALSSLAVYGIIMAGWGSNSKYSLLGGLRSSAQVISYELTLGLSLIGVFLLAGTLNPVDIAGAQHPSPTIHAPGTPGIWFVLLQPVAFFIFFTSATAEANRSPFDLPEAESELVAGYHTEYSGVRFLLFQLGEYMGMIIMSFISVVCFLGAWVSPFAAFIDGTNIPFLSGLLGSGAHWVFIKWAFVIFVYYWMRWTLPRFRYDQLMGLCWKVFLPLILTNILIIAVLKLIFFGPGVPAENQLFWWIIAVVELILGFLALYGFSRFAGLGWFGSAERPVLVEPQRSVILVRNVQGGRGTIEGEARPMIVTRSSGGGEL